MSDTLPMKIVLRVSGVHIQLEHSRNQLAAYEDDESYYDILLKAPRLEARASLCFKKLSILSFVENMKKFKKHAAGVDIAKLDCSLGARFGDFEIVSRHFVEDIFSVAIKFKHGREDLWFCSIDTHMDSESCEFLVD